MNSLLIFFFVFPFAFFNAQNVSTITTPTEEVITDEPLTDAIEVCNCSLEYFCFHTFEDTSDCFNCNFNMSMCVDLYPQTHTSCASTEITSETTTEQIYYCTCAPFEYYCKNNVVIPDCCHYNPSKCDEIDISSSPSTTEISTTDLSTTPEISCFCLPIEYFCENLKGEDWPDCCGYNPSMCPEEDTSSNITTTDTVTPDRVCTCPPIKYFCEDPSYGWADCCGYDPSMCPDETTTDIITTTEELLACSCAPLEYYCMNPNDNWADCCHYDPSMCTGTTNTPDPCEQ